MKANYIDIPYDILFDVLKKANPNIPASAEPLDIYEIQYSTSPRVSLSSTRFMRFVLKDESFEDLPEGCHIPSLRLYPKERAG